MCRRRPLRATSSCPGALLRRGRGGPSAGFRAAWRACQHGWEAPTWGGPGRAAPGPCRRRRPRPAGPGRGRRPGAPRPALDPPIPDRGPAHPRACRVDRASHRATPAAPRRRQTARPGSPAPSATRVGLPSASVTLRAAQEFTCPTVSCGPSLTGTTPAPIPSGPSVSTGTPSWSTSTGTACPTPSRPRPPEAGAGLERRAAAEVAEDITAGPDTPSDPHQRRIDPWRRR